MLKNFNLTLRRPNFLGVHVPVTPDLAKTVKGKSDHSEKWGIKMSETKKFLRKWNSAKKGD